MFQIFNGQVRGLGERPKQDIHMKVSVDFRKYLHHFKGAKLAVFTAIALHADENGWAMPVIGQLETETGYEPGTISNALTSLCKTEIDGKRVLLVIQERLKGKFVRNHYLIFPSPDEITKFAPVSRKSRIRKTTLGFSSTEKPNSENAIDGIKNPSMEEPFIDNTNTFPPRHMPGSDRADSESGIDGSAGGGEGDPVKPSIKEGIEDPNPPVPPSPPSPTASFAFSERCFVANCEREATYGAHGHSYCHMHARIVASLPDDYDPETYTPSADPEPARRSASMMIPDEVRALPDAQPWRALTVKREYAERIARGDKTYEVRNFKTDYRGPIVFTISGEQIAFCVADLDGIYSTEAVKDKLSPAELEYGKYAWRFVNARYVEPVKVSGKQGLWTWTLPIPDVISDDEYERRIAAAGKAKVDKPKKKPETITDIAQVDPVFRAVCRLFMKTHPVTTYNNKKVSGLVWALVADVVNAEKALMETPGSLDQVNRERLEGELVGMGLYFDENCKGCTRPRDREKFGTLVLQWYEAGKPNPERTSGLVDDPVHPGQRISKALLEQREAANRELAAKLAARNTNTNVDKSSITTLRNHLGGSNE